MSEVHTPLQEILDLPLGIKAPLFLCGGVGVLSGGVGVGVAVVGEGGGVGVVVVWVGFGVHGVLVRDVVGGGGRMFCGMGNGGEEGGLWCGWWVGWCAGKF